MSVCAGVRVSHVLTVSVSESVYVCKCLCWMYMRVGVWLLSMCVWENVSVLCEREFVRVIVRDLERMITYVLASVSVWVSVCMRVYKNARKKKKKKLVETATAKSTIIKKLQNCDFLRRHPWTDSDTTKFCRKNTETLESRIFANFHLRVQKSFCRRLVANFCRKLPPIEQI